MGKDGVLEGIQVDFRIHYPQWSLCAVVFVSRVRGGTQRERYRLSAIQNENYLQRMATKALSPSSTPTHRSSSSPTLDPHFHSCPLPHPSRCTPHPGQLTSTSSRPSPP